MKHSRKFLQKKWCAFVLLVSLISCLYAQVPQQEVLDRGVVAVKTTSGVFVSWRFLGTDPQRVGFNLYRDGEKVNEEPIRTLTNYTDSKGTAASTYVVETVLNDESLELSKETKVWEDGFLRIELQRPPDGITPPYSVTNDKKKEDYPDGQEYDYSPNDCSVGDVDGDGEYEIIVKWDPSNSRDNSHRGYTGNVYLDCYKLDGTFMWRIDLGKNIRAGAHYTQFLVYDFDGDGKAEVVCRTAPGTIDGEGKYVLLNGDDPNADYRSGGSNAGIIMSGKDYLTVFNGETGAEITTVEYNPPYGKSTDWGKDSYGNRQNRFLACVAYLDGVKPSIVMCRGMYQRAALVAYDFDGEKLTQRWIHDAKTSGQGAYGEGAHSLSVGDVDGDGFDEIVYGSCVIDHDGSLLYRTGFGHGDALHLGDFDPDRDGLEIFMVHEETSAPYGFAMRAAEANKVLYGMKTGEDVGRGLTADIDPNHRGSEFWSTSKKYPNVYSVKGDIIHTSRPSVNFRIYWDGDLQDELLDGTVISKWNGTKANTVIDFSKTHNAQSCNSTKKTPNLSADILGDWREEVILWDGNTSSHLLIFTTTTPTDYRIPTLMHDHIYRMSVAWQNVAYNQPPHVGYYMGDMDNINVTFSLTGEGAASQVKEIGYAITPITYTWRNATDVEVTGLPEGLTYKKDLDYLSVTISGTPAETGTFEYKVTSVDGVANASVTGTIRVIEEVVLTPVAYFAFDETGGDVAKNQISGEAKAVNFTPGWVEGVVGNAIEFSSAATDARMVQPHYDAFTFGQEDFSVELLFRSGGGEGVDWYLFHTGSHAKNEATGTTGKWIGLEYKNGNLVFAIDDDDDANKRGKTSVSVAAESYFNNQWRHVVGVRSIEDKKIKIYLDGELKGEVDDITGDISQMEDLIIGNCNVNFDTPYQGAIDELTFFKGAMTDDRVKARYKAFLNPDDPNSVNHTLEQSASFVRIYPTHFDDQIVLDFATDSACKVDITIYSVSGTLVYQHSYAIQGNENIVLSGLGDLPDGVYSVNIETPEAGFVGKIMK